MYPDNPTHYVVPVGEIERLQARIAELESAVAYTTGRNPVTVVVELQQRIRELEAQLAAVQGIVTMPDGMRHA